MSELWKRLPLPQEHVAGMIAGLFLQSRTPGRRLPASLALVGWPVLAMGLSLTARAVRARGPGHLERPERLATTGAYSVSRNPMYVGWSLLHLGTGITLRSPWVLLTWPMAFVLVHRTVLQEERLLAARFGDAWADYARHVPRYLSASPARRPIMGASRGATGHRG